MADIEDALDLDSFDELGARLQKRRTRDLIAIIEVLSKAGGNPVTADEVGEWGPEVLNKISGVFVEKEAPGKPPAKKPRRSTGKRSKG